MGGGGVAGTWITRNRKCSVCVRLYIVLNGWLFQDEIVVIANGRFFFF